MRVKMCPQRLAGGIGSDWWRPSCRRVDGANCKWKNVKVKEINFFLKFWIDDYQNFEIHFVGYHSRTIFF